MSPAGAKESFTALRLICFRTVNHGLQPWLHSSAATRLSNMTIFQAIIFGAVQGLTEFLPISSTAHLILLPWFMGWPDPGLAFDVALHLGTLVALLIYFRAEWIALITSALGLVRGRTQSPDARMAMFIVAATIPGAVAGALFEHKVEDALRSPELIAVMLIVMALVLVAAEFIGHRKKSLDEISWGDAL